MGSGTEPFLGDFSWEVSFFDSFFSRFLPRASSNNFASRLRNLGITLLSVTVFGLRLELGHFEMARHRISQCPDFGLRLQIAEVALKKSYQDGVYIDLGEHTSLEIKAETNDN